MYLLKIFITSLHQPAVAGKQETERSIMRHFTDISDSYQGAELSFFLIEGEKDKALNRYVRGHVKSIEKHLKQRGVRYATFNFVSRSLFGSRSLKNLILRQYPTLGKEELNERIKSFRKEEKSKSRSRLMYICDVTPTEEGSYCADILYEDNFDRDGDYLTTLYRFLDNVVRCDIARDSRGVPGHERYRLQGDDSREAWDNSEYLGSDLLAGSILPEECATVSPIHFDSKFNITLPLYPQITIKLEPLPKALYILFLQHPEGIVLKEIHDYENELKRIYSAVSGRKNKSVLDRMFRTLTDPNENPLHKNLSIIRRCFLSKLRFDIACNYIPAHSRAKAHNIPIDSQLVELPEI